MRRFRLADRDLAALAAGRPSTETVTELRKAQLSRHLLLLSEILTAGRPSWYEPSPPRHILTDPITGLYAATTVTTMRSGSRPFDRPALVGDTPTVAVTCDDLTLRVRLEDADPLRDRLGLPPSGRLSGVEIAHWRNLLSQAWPVLVRRHRPWAEILAGVLRVIVPVRPDPAADGVSATSAHAYGAVAMSAPTDPRSLAVGLVHETAHSLLNATTLLFDLVRPSPALSYSPWRDDPRPASGLLHGAYAYAAVTRFWRTEAALGGDRRAEFEFARWRTSVVAAAGELLTATRAGSAGGGGPDSGSGGDPVLTAVGRRFVTAFRDEVAAWLDEPVDADVARLAAGANLDHRVRWRLRNLRVTDETTGALVDAWRRGRPMPPLPAPEVLAGERRLEAGQRLALVHRWLHGGDPPGPPGGGVGAGDVAWLGGRYGTARAAYREALENDREIDAALAGLALVSDQRALRERPEVVRAFWLASDRRPTLNVLLEWLSVI